PDTVRLSALPTLPDDPFGLISRQRRAAAGDRRAQHLAHAADRLAGAPPVSTVPADHAVDGPAPPDAHWVPLPLPAELGRAVTAFARRQRVSPFIVYSAAVHLLVRLYSGQDDTLVGFMVAHRDGRHRDVVSLQAQTLVQRLRVDGSAPV